MLAKLFDHFWDNGFDELADNSDHGFWLDRPSDGLRVSVTAPSKPGDWGYLRVTDEKRDVLILRLGANGPWGIHPEAHGEAGVEMLRELIQEVPAFDVPYLRLFLERYPAD